MKGHYIFPIMLLSLITISCRKELPNESQTGSDTFGCYVNGKRFVPKGSPLAGPVLKAQKYLYNGKTMFSISASMAEGENRNAVSLFADSVNLAVGTYAITTPNVGSVSGYYGSPDPLSPQALYTSTSTFAGQLTINYYDPVQNIVSGTFYFDAVNNSGLKVEITDGRFDVRLY